MSELHVSDKTRIVQEHIPIFSLFKKPISNILPCRQVSLLDVYHLIKGDSFASQTSTLRDISKSTDARKYKSKNFDYVTFSGSFSMRNEAKIISHSGLLTIDFDHIENIPLLRGLLLNDQYLETELMFISPSGDGLKWIIPIDLAKANHKDYFKAIENYISQTYQIEIDKSGKDISRACFLAHDKDVFINPKYL